jgi:hypothetical protein
MPRRPPSCRRSLGFFLVDAKSMNADEIWKQLSTHFELVLRKGALHACNT